MKQKPIQVDSASRKKPILPLVIVIICISLLSLQVMGMIGEHRANKIAQQSKDAEAYQSVTDAISDPESEETPPISETEDVPEEEPVSAPFPLLPKDEILWSATDVGKTVALTFDDGPNSKYTMEYLKILREYEVPATFFLIGNRVETYPALAKAIAEEGHEIGNHTYNHPNLPRQKDAVIKDQITRTSDLIRNSTSQKEVTLLRPPGGNYNDRVRDIALENDLRVVMWKIYPRDWEKNKTADDIIKIIKGSLESGAIILLHEGKPQTLKALPILINDLRKDGWNFVTVSQLAGETVYP